MLLRWTFAAVPLSLQLHDGLFCVLVSLLVPTHLTKCGADVQVGGCWILSRLRLQLHLQRPEEVLKRRVKLTPPLEKTSHVVEGHRAEAETSGTIVLETALVVGENLCFFQKLVRLVKLSSFHQLHRERIIARRQPLARLDRLVARWAKAFDAQYEQLLHAHDRLRVIPLSLQRSHLGLNSFEVALEVFVVQIFRHAARTAP
mmetsp:Transcript_18918/g.46910  ORF Transcript_18918/g.46910 Transcript_18918/m.46910 type:complete len:202 (-) Transcript_18918:293-898(-)